MSEWIRITDQLPEIEHEVLVRVEYKGNMFIAKRIGDGVYIDDCEEEFYGVTHWMPLPPQPADTQQPR